MIRNHRRVAIGAAAVIVLGCVLAAWWEVRAFRRTRESLSRGSVDAVLVAGPAPKPTRIVTFGEGCLTSRCHSVLKDRAAVHSPVAKGKCDDCHAADAGNHTYPLVRAKGELCTGCHTTGAGMAFQHRAENADGCLACHDPHSSGSKSLLVGASVAQTCVRCHPRTEGSVQHASYKGERCELCHAPHDAANATLLVGGAGPEHCATCHETTVRRVRAGQHHDLKGECLACHAPHASEHKNLMIGENGSVCLGCHADVGRTIAGATVSHDPVLKGERCTICHDPHGAGEARMLRQTQAKVCLSCHDKAVQAADGRKIPELASVLANSALVHGAIRIGECSACHSVHGGSHGSHEGLLREAAASAPGGGYDDHNYTLCFGCHDPALTRSSAATRFRDGDRNLHEVHLRPGDRARSCAACHAVHAGDSPKLIARAVNFEGSKWEMPLGFTATEDGGRCATSCHEPLSYSRRAGGATQGGVR